MKYEGLPKDLFQSGFAYKGQPQEPLRQEMVERISDWLYPKVKKSGSVCMHFSSYTLKHYYERKTGDYIGNGELIAAFLLLDFKYKRQGLNAYFYADFVSLKNLA